VRTKQIPSCPQVAGSSQTVYCYYDTYDENTRGKSEACKISNLLIDNSSFGIGEHSWQKFHTAEENGIQAVVSR
jgi:hypothetical protein